MVAESPSARSFTLPQLKLDKIETALTEPRYMVTMVGQGRRLMVAPKLADVITQLQQGKSIEEASAALSALWGKELSAESLRLIVEQQMVRQGLAYPVEQGEPPQVADVTRAVKFVKKPLRERLLTGQFAWRLLKGKHVGKICSPLAIFFEPLTVLFALLFIVATRWAFYSTMDRHFVQQSLMQFDATEYLTNLGLLLCVILIHEFGHAAAQLKFRVPTGGIGFQLHYYLPAFYTNVSASWALKSRQRVVVDAGGIYFQSIASSVLCLIYLRTGSLALLTTVVASDMLCFIAINPFLRFDGYWLLSDSLAVPNLQKHSSEALKYFGKRLIGRAKGANAPPLSRWRLVAVTVYAILKNCFWVLLVVGVVFKARRILEATSVTFQKFGSQVMEGLKTTDARLVFASIIQLLIFVLLLMTLGVLVGKLIGKLYGVARGALAWLLARLQSGHQCSSEGAAD